MKKILIVLVIVLIALLAIGIVKDQIIKAVVITVATQVTGAPVHIDGFSLGIFTQTVRISGFKMYNPQGFSRGIMVDLTKANVTYDLGALFGKKLHLANVEIELKELGLEKNKDGKLNVDELKVVKEAAAGKKENKPSPEQMPLQIDLLKLGMGRIVSKDYSAGAEPVVSVYDINLHKTYKNITSAQQLAALILAEPMKSAGIQGAKIYGAAMLAGVAVLPVAVAATFLGKDSVEKEFSAPFDKIYEEALAIMKRKGKITREDKGGGIIAASINSVDVSLKIRKIADNKNQVTVSARKFLLPKPEISGGILYDLSEKIK